MDWKVIPSLAALRAFDAFARQGSFSAAARDLNVTHAAIAQHVRALENHFGEALAERHGQAMRLTPTGSELAAALGEGFDIIADAVARLSDRHAERPVTVTLTPSFAEAWLMPRIGGFWAAHPDVEVHLVPSVELSDLRRDGIDIAIRFGEGDWPGLEVEPLSVSPFVVVAAPGHAVRKDAFAREKWLYSCAAREQVVWAGRIGVDFAAVGAQEMETNGMVLSAVRAGLGLSVQSRAIVETDLASGQMVALEEGEAEGFGYHIVTRPGPMKEGARTFLRWLRRAARAESPQDPVG